MDFLVQEMHREVNTTGSKSQSTGDLQPASSSSRPSWSGSANRCRTSNELRGHSTAVCCSCLSPLGDGEDHARPPLRAGPPRGAMFTISMTTTREPRGAERDGVDYHFVDALTFQRMIERDEFVEWAEVHGNFYGSPRSRVDQAFSTGGIAVFDIDVQGGRSIQRRYPEAVLVFVLPPRMAELERRLRERGTDERGRDPRADARRPLRAGARCPGVRLPGGQRLGGAGLRRAGVHRHAPSAAGGEGWTSPRSASRDRSEAVDTARRSFYLARPSPRSGEGRWAAHRAGADEGVGSRG